MNRNKSLMANTRTVTFKSQKKIEICFHRFYRITCHEGAEKD